MAQPVPERLLHLHVFLIIFIRYRHSIHRLFSLKERRCQVFHLNEKQYEKVIFKNMQTRKQLFKSGLYLVYAGVLS